MPRQTCGLLRRLLGPGGKQRPTQVAVLMFGSESKRRQAFLCAMVDIRLCLQEDGHHLEAATFCCLNKRGPPFFGLVVHLCIRSEQQGCDLSEFPCLNDLVVIIVGGSTPAQHQRCIAVLVSVMDISSHL